MQCTATVYKTGEQCRRRAVTGRKVCQVHGGVTPRGVASPHYKEGRYSKSIPARLAGRYEESRNDPRLLDLEDEIGLLDARLTDLLSRVDTGESGAIWQGLRAQRMEFLLAQRTADNKGQVEAMRAILDLIEQGHADYRAWAEVHTVLEQRKRMAESERKRLVEMQQMITSQQVMALLGAVVGVVRDHVHDRGVLSAISAGIDNLLIASPTDA